MTKKPEDNPVDLDQIRELIDLLIEKDVSELEIERQGMKVKIRRRNGEVATTVAAAPQVAASNPQPVPVETSQEVAEPETPAEEAGFGDAYIVTSPMVGTFYRTAEPGADPFTDVGDAVEEGQTLCIVEAMKLMNEIASEIPGEVLAIFVENAEPVEFGQQLFAIRPRG